jgi:hypothetical protein
MKILIFLGMIYLQVLNYKFWWLAFIAIAIICAKTGKWFAVIAGHIAILLIVGYLDAEWLSAEMSKPGWDPMTGPDLDIVFEMGVIVRVFLVNLTLLPLSIFYLKKKRKLNKPLQPTA